jgi:hypothetical protein
MATPTALPAAFTAGQVLTAAQMNDLRGAFRILQVIEGTTSTQVVTTSTSYVTTNLTATITPSATSSKVLVLVNSPSGKDSSVFSGIYTALFRGTVAGTNLAENLLFAGGNSTYLMSTFSFLDSPNTTSATAYTLGIKTGSASTAVYGNADNKRSSIILMEISA